MENQILLNGISFEDLQNSIRKIIQSELKDAVEILRPKEEPKTPKFFTRKETAEVLGISLGTLHDWTKKGTLQAKRIGKSIRYEESVVLNSLKDINTIKHRRS